MMGDISPRHPTLSVLVVVQLLEPSSHLTIILRWLTLSLSVATHLAFPKCHAEGGEALHFV